MDERSTCDIRSTQAANTAKVGMEIGYCCSSTGHLMNRVKRVLRIHQLAHSLGVYDSSIVGMAGEVIAEQDFGMMRTKRQNPGFDGYVIVNGMSETMEVKSLSTSRLRQHGGKATFKVSKTSEPVHLLVLAIFEKQSKYEVLFHGRTSTVGNPSRTNKSTRRAIRVEELFVGREAELQKLLLDCYTDVHVAG